MIPSLTSSASSWAGQIGLGPWGPTSASWTPAQPPSACHMGGWWGRSPCGHPLPEVPLKKSDAPSCSWQWASLQLLTGRAWSHEDAMCQPQVPCLVCVRVEGLCQAVLDRACHWEWGRVWGRQRGGRQSKPWKKMLFMQGCMCVGMHACRGKGGMQRDAPGCGDPLHAGMDTAPRGPKAPSARWTGAHSLCRGTEAPPFPLTVWLGLWNIRGNKNEMSGVWKKGNYNK